MLDGLYTASLVHDMRSELRSTSVFNMYKQGRLVYKILTQLEQIYFYSFPQTLIYVTTKCYLRKTFTF
jgi:hypothetical protein